MTGPRGAAGSAPSKTQTAPAAPAQTQIESQKRKPAGSQPGGASTPALQAPPVPLLPAAGEAGDMAAEETENLLRAVVTYNEFHTRRTIKEDTLQWFKSFPDVPVHPLPPLEIHKPDSSEELLTYTSLWRQQEAVTALDGTGLYKGGANIFWLKGFVDRSKPELRRLAAVAGDRPVFRQVDDAARSYV